MTQLSSLIEAVCNELPCEMMYGVATATGGTTTIIDTVNTVPDDFYNGGLIFFLEGPSAGLISKVTDYVNSTGTFTFTPAMNAMSTANTRSFAVCNDAFPKRNILAAINQAVNSMTPRPEEYTKATVTNTLEYTMIDGVGNISKVEYGYTSESPRRYTTCYHWTEIKGSSTIQTLRFDPGYEPPAGMTLRITYWGSPSYPSRMILDTQLLDWWLPYERLMRSAVVNCLRQKYQNSGKDMPAIMDLLNEAKTLEQKAIDTYPIPRPNVIHLRGWRNGESEDNWPAPV